MSIAVAIDPRYEQRFKFPKWSRTVTVVDEPRLFPRVFPELTKADHLRFAELYARAAGDAHRKWMDDSEKALKRYGDHGSLISGVIRNHFPDATKNRLREEAQKSTQFSSMSIAHWAASGKRTPWRMTHLHDLAFPAGPNPHDLATALRHAGGGGAHAKKPTRYEELQASLPADWIVRTWSPGDGVTRYRFFHKAPAKQTYFGPDSGAFTALGISEADTFARGLHH